MSDEKSIELPVFPHGSIWRDSLSYKKEDECYDFYIMLQGEWKYCGRYEHYTRIDFNQMVSK